MDIKILRHLNKEKFIQSGNFSNSRFLSINQINVCLAGQKYRCHFYQEWVYSGARNRKYLCLFMTKPMFSIAFFCQSRGIIRFLISRCIRTSGVVKKGQVSHERVWGVNWSYMRGWVSLWEEG